MTESPIHNWQDKDHYDELELLYKKEGNLLLAWEFLRRNPTYRNDWRNFASSPEGHSESDLTQKYGLIYRLRDPYHDYKAALDIFMPPRSHPWYWDFADESLLKDNPVLAHLQGRSKRPVPTAPDEILVKFNVHALKPQLRILELFLEQHNQTSATPSPKLKAVINYIRCLDAIDAQEPARIIISTLFPAGEGDDEYVDPKSSYDKARKQAMAYRNNKWKELVPSAFRVGIE
jgi:hypothetical protein